MPVSSIPLHIAPWRSAAAPQNHLSGAGVPVERVAARGAAHRAAPAARVLRLRGGREASCMQEGDAGSVVGCCGLGWVVRSKTNSQPASFRNPVPAKGNEARPTRLSATLAKIQEIGSRVLAQKCQVAAILASGSAAVWRLLRAGSSKRATDTHVAEKVATTTTQEKRSFLENSLRARQLMLQGLEDGQLPPSPRYLLTLGEPSEKLICCAQRRGREFAPTHLALTFDLCTCLPHVLFVHMLRTVVWHDLGRRGMGVFQHLLPGELQHLVPGELQHLVPGELPHAGARATGKLAPWRTEAHECPRWCADSQLEQDDTFSIIPACVWVIRRGCSRQSST